MKSAQTLGKIDESETLKSDSSEMTITRKKMIYLLGVSFYWTWFFLMIFTDVVTFPLPATLFIEPVYREVSFIGMVTTCLATIVAKTRIAKKQRSAATKPPNRKFPAVVYLVISPWASLVTAGSFVGIICPRPIIITSWFLFGVSAMGVFFITILPLVDTSRKTSFFILGSAVTLGALFYLIIASFSSGPLPIILTAILPAFALLCAQCETDVQDSSSEELTDKSQTEESKLGKENLRKNPLPTEIATEASHEKRYYAGEPTGTKGCFQQLFFLWPTQPLFGVAFGLTVGISISGSVLETSTFPLELVIAFCLAGPTLMFFACFLETIDTDLVCQLLLTAVAISLLPLILETTKPVTIVSYALLAFCYSIYDLIHTLSLIELAHEQPEMNSICVLATGKALLFTGLAIGWGIHILLIAMIASYAFTYRIILAITIALIICLIDWIYATSLKNGSEESVQLPTKTNSSSDKDEILAKMTREFGLSTRQGEIFIYLAKGRNAPYIAEKLVLSHHTVKSHIYRIYQQMDIHSHQELIDIVEKRFENPENDIAHSHHTHMLTKKNQ